MKKTKLTRSLLAACSIVALTAVMYGCVHDGSDAPPADDMTDMEPDPGIAQKEAIDSAISTAMGAVGAVSADPSGVTDAQVTAADDAITAANTAIAAGTDVGAADIATANTAVSGLQDSLRNAKAVRMAASNLAGVQGMAATAASDAQTAADNAKGSADDADMARENAATMQTGETSSGLATKAREAADAAQTAADDAEAASDAAAAATDAGAAAQALVMAQNALKAATGHETDADDYGQMAEDAAGGELKIDGTMKSVGGTTLDAKAPSNVVTITEGDDDPVVTDTGYQDGVTTPGAMTMGATAVARVVTDGVETTPYTAPSVNAAARSLTIGMSVDSADDMARLTIVDSYADTKTVNVFAANMAETGADDISGTATTVSVEDTLTDGGSPETVNRALRFHGTYYKAGGETAAAIAPGDTDTNGVSDEAEGERVYSYVSSVGADFTLGTDDDDVSYVVEHRRVDQAGTTTVYYREADIADAGVDHDGDADTETITPAVTAVLPVATKYEHIHFGVWSALEDGTDIDGLGIGFVQNFSGSGMTTIGGGRDDMPNGGSADYSGNWVAAIQSAHRHGEGVVNVESGTASISADFDDAELTVNLMGLAMLSGDIDGNMFSGDEADVARANLGDGDFEGTFSGGFYGTRAAEAGGIFDFDGGNDGAFVGAFGAAEDD